MITVLSILGFVLFIGLILILQKNSNSNKLDAENKTIDAEMTKKRIE